MAVVLFPRALPAPLAQRLPGCELVIGPAWRDRLADAAAIVPTVRDAVDAAAIAAAPRLRVIAACAVGVDHVDVAAATAAGVCVTHTPDVLTDATADLTLALLLAAARRLPEGEALVRSGAWTGWEPDQLLGRDLAGARLLIVGAGRIGRAVAHRAQAFGMRVVLAGRGDDLEAAMATADVISLHCPLSPATRGLISRARLAQCRRQPILINTARGPIVDEDAVCDALDQGLLAAAAFDVYDGEPTVNPRLRSHPRVVLAPHLGSATTGTRIHMAELACAAVVEVLAGRRPTHLVDASAWERRR